MIAEIDFIFCYRRNGINNKAYDNNSITVSELKF